VAEYEEGNKKEEVKDRSNNGHFQTVIKVCSTSWQEANIRTKHFVFNSPSPLP